MYDSNARLTERDFPITTRGYGQKVGYIYEPASASVVAHSVTFQPCAEMNGWKSPSNSSYAPSLDGDNSIPAATLPSIPNWQGNLLKVQDPRFVFGQAALTTCGRVPDINASSPTRVRISFQVTTPKP